MRKWEYARLTLNYKSICVRGFAQVYLYVFVCEYECIVYVLKQ